MYFFQHLYHSLNSYWNFKFTHLTPPPLCDRWHHHCSSLWKTYISHRSLSPRYTFLKSIHPSIHPSIHFLKLFQGYICKLGSINGASRHSPPKHHFAVPLRKSPGIARPDEMHNFSSNFRAVNSVYVSGKPPMQRNPEPHHHNWLFCTLSPLWMLEPFILSSGSALPLCWRKS